MGILGGIRRTEEVECFWGCFDLRAVYLSHPVPASTGGQTIDILYLIVDST